MDDETWRLVLDIHFLFSFPALHSVHYSTATKKLILRLNDAISADSVTRMSVDTALLEQTHDGSIVRGVSVTKKATAEDKLGQFDNVGLGHPISQRRARPKHTRANISPGNVRYYPTPLKIAKSNCRIKCLFGELGLSSRRRRLCFPLLHSMEWDTGRSRQWFFAYEFGSLLGKGAGKDGDAIDDALQAGRSVRLGLEPRFDSGDWRQGGKSELKLTSRSDSKFAIFLSFRDQKSIWKLLSGNSI